MYAHYIIISNPPIYLWEIIIYLFKVWNSNLKAKTHKSICLPSATKYSTELAEKNYFPLFFFTLIGGVST